MEKFVMDTWMREPRRVSSGLNEFYLANGEDTCTACDVAIQRNDWVHYVEGEGLQHKLCPLTFAAWSATR